MVPDYPEGDQITVRMLMNHSSGIGDISQIQIDTKCPTPHKMLDPDALIEASTDEPRASFEPGDGSSYSSANTIILGRIMEKVSGKSYEALLGERLFHPLGLERTRLDSDGELQAPFTHGYTDFCSSSLGADADTSDWTMLAFSAGALASTIDDLHAYGVAFGEGYGLDAELRRARIDDAAPTDPSSGLGLVVQPGDADEVISIGHAGAEPGYSANLAYYPCSGTVFAAMANADFEPALIDILTALQPVVEGLATGGCSR